MDHLTQRQPVIAAQEVVDYLGDAVTSRFGPAGIRLSEVRPLDAVRPGALTYCRQGVERLLDRRAGLDGAAVLCTPAEAAAAAELAGTLLMVCDNPRLLFIRAVTRFFAPERPLPGIHPRAVVAQPELVDPRASVAAGCVLAPGVEIGADTILFPNVVVNCPTRIGARVRIQSGTVIGADGFGYERNASGELEAFPHIGGVVIGDDVHIGANTCIDRGTLSDTMIEAGAKIDNLVHISHNVHIGANAVVIANSMVGGSARIGERAWLAPSVSVMNQVRVGADATVGLGATVVKNVEPAEVVMGAPAVPQERFRKTQAALKRLLQHEAASGQ